MGKWQPKKFVLNIDNRIEKWRKKSWTSQPSLTIPHVIPSSGPILRIHSPFQTSCHKKRKREVNWFGRPAMLYLPSLDKPSGFWPVCSFPPRDSAAESVVSLMALPAPLVVCLTVPPKPVTSKLWIRIMSVAPFTFIEGSHCMYATPLSRIDKLTGPGSGVSDTAH